MKLLLLWLLLSGASAEDVQVAVASNFAAAAESLAAEFRRETGHRALISSGSTGKFLAQIRSGAPFGVLLAADQSTVSSLVADQLAVAGTSFTYAVGRLALWSPRGSFVDPDGEVLRKGEFKHLSIANPKVAPYGLAARQVLEKLGLWEKLQSRLVLGENIAQAHQFVASGNAELGFVAYSQIQRAKGSFWLVPEELHSPLRQDAVLLARGKDRDAARQFLAFLKARKAVVRGFGYEVP